MTEIDKLFERHKEWHKSRIALSWPEKIRMAEAVRESVKKMREMRTKRLNKIGNEKTEMDKG